MTLSQEDILFALTTMFDCLPLDAEAVSREYGVPMIDAERLCDIRNKLFEN